MRTFREIKEALKTYKGAVCLYKPMGYIAWQYSTGGNVEILYIETIEARKGFGKMLLREMCRRIKPYNSVFVFRRKANSSAGKFYRAMGFKEKSIKGLYQNELAVLGVINYEELLKRCNQ